MALRKLARSTTSGSQAALSITVTPSASVAAIMTLAVPSTVEPARPPRNIAEPDQALGAGLHVAALDDDLRAQRLEAFQVEVDGPRADDAAAGQRDGGLLQPAQQRPHDADGAAHLADQIVVARAFDLAGLDADACRPRSAPGRPAR